MRIKRQCKAGMRVLYTGRNEKANGKLVEVIGPMVLST
jgi:hypothetical protein